MMSVMMEDKVKNVLLYVAITLGILAYLYLVR